ncbi:thermonuclease family protein [Paracoccus sp. Ld10]|uniref:thermonuclease family protein n=1 Tax=Paracoccus sp. Ld10 TaxID=649158 RepID=UPI00386BA5A0
MLGGGARVIDGDTLDVDGKRVRLHGIDAPESNQTRRHQLRVGECGVEATRALERLIGISAVTCEKRATDRYGRMVATCDAGGRKPERPNGAAGVCRRLLPVWRAGLCR